MFVLYLHIDAVRWLQDGDSFRSGDDFDLWLLA